MNSSKRWVVKFLKMHIFFNGINEMLTRNANLNFLFVGVIFGEGKAHTFVTGQKSERKIKRANRFLSFIALMRSYIFLFSSIWFTYWFESAEKPIKPVIFRYSLYLSVIIKLIRLLLYICCHHFYFACLFFYNFTVNFFNFFFLFITSSASEYTKIPLVALKMYKCRSNKWNDDVNGIVKIFYRL